MPVIVVGNISVGGNGKTPLVITLCKWLYQNGYRPGVISRGYGGSMQDFPYAVTPNDNPKQVGDEPYLMSKNIDNPIVIDPIRSRGAKYLVEKLQCNVIISDDGLQHYALKRDVEIAVIDGNRRHGNGYLLPMGPLRERTTRLKSVDYIVVNGGESDNSEIPMLLTSGQLVNVADRHNKMNIDDVSEPVIAMAGIGNPQRFFDTLKSKGVKLAKEMSFPDHHAFKPSDLNFDLSEGANGMVLMTEKDAVKCEIFAQNNWWYLPVTGTLPDDFLKNILQN